MKTTTRRIAITLLTLFPAAVSNLSFAQAEAKTTWDPEVKWAATDAEFKKKDAENPPKAGGIVFLGSSSFRLWDVERSFPNLNVINRGFGGSTMPDAVHFAERWVVPLKPKCILVYEGDNDIKNGFTAEEVAANYRALIDIFDKALPETPVIFVAIKPSISRWTMWSKMKKANQLIADFSAQHKNLYYADIATPMLEFNGLPKAFLFKSDGLHLNEVGYEIWQSVIGPMIEKASAE